MTDYGRVLDYQGSGAECPPEDIYTFEVIDITDPEEKPGYNEGEIDIQCHATCKLQNYPYDPDDEDDYDWNGTEVRHYLTLARRYRDKNTDELKPPSPVWKSERSSSRPFVEALFPEWDWSKEGLKTRALVLDDFIGRRFRATCKPNDKGYARLSGFAKAGKGARRPPVQAQPQQQLQQALEPDDPSVDDDNLLEDES